MSTESIAVAYYQSLISDFLCEKLTAEKFQKNYLNQFKNERTKFAQPIYDLLQELFGDLDSYTTDATLLAEEPDFYLDELELEKKVVEIASRLEKLISLT
jgi:hypothetical protein